MPPHAGYSGPAWRLFTVSTLAAITTKPVTVIRASMDATRRCSEGWRAARRSVSSQAGSQRQALSR